MRIDKFRILVHESTRQSYEDLFVKIMGYYDPNFKPVKPHGNIGDRGNDGWCACNGKYYQVYAPDELTKNNKEAIKKLKSDFLNLKLYWDSISKVKTFIFVVNDKFKGVSPHIYKALDDLKREHDLEAAQVMDAHDLQKTLFKLKEAEISSIVGGEEKSINLNNEKVFQFWYKAVDAKRMTYNANYLPHQTHNVKFSRSFINSLKSFHLNSYNFLNEPSSNLADTSLINAIMDFRSVTFDLINSCEEFDNKLNINNGIVTFWVEGSDDFEYIQIKKWTLKALFYHLIKFSNRIIYIKNNLGDNSPAVEYICYHEEYYPNFPLLGDIEPSPAIYIGSEGQELFYPGLSSIEKYITKQLVEQNRH
ncbi:hypothetical protein ACB035_03085 [Aeromonas sp. S12(2024)]|uniref:hypothetical protein n=1 Tax=Aeromonas sp. S12(2024) TaxID=3242885 RepID=UPI003527DC46